MAFYLHTLPQGTPTWGYYIDPVSLTLTYFSRSQSNFHAKVRNIKSLINQKVFKISLNGFKHLHYKLFHIFWQKKVKVTRAVHAAFLRVPDFNLLTVREKLDIIETQMTCHLMRQGSLHRGKESFEEKRYGFWPVAI